MAQAQTQIGGSVVADFDLIEPTRCPCGYARRAFTDVEGAPMSVHRVEIDHDAQTHYHKKQTEVYYFLECEPDAQMEIDGEMIPVHAGMSVYIRPGTRHRAVGKMTILNLVIPKFDPEDEWFD